MLSETRFSHKISVLECGLSGNGQGEKGYKTKRMIMEYTDREESDVKRIQKRIPRQEYYYVPYPDTQM